MGYEQKQKDLVPQGLLIEIEGSDTVWVINRN